MTGAERLEAFFTRHDGVTKTQLAAALKVSRTVIFYWCTGRVTPNPERRRDIAAFTRGEVSEDAWGVLEESSVKPFDEPAPEPSTEKGAA